MSDTRLTLALGEYDIGWHDPTRSLAAAERIFERTASVGAQVVVLPEMTTTGFTMDREQSVPIDSGEVHALRELARKYDVWTVAGVALRAEEDPACAVNAALAIDPSGDIVAIHRKQRLFAYGEEHKAYAPGTESTVITIGGVHVGIFICYELRFPEVFGAVAREVDAMVLIANWPAMRQEHWDALLRARAIENQCYVVGVNRVGTANGLAYVGGSTGFDPWGDRMPPALCGSTRLVTVDASRTRELRAKYPFLKDRR